MRRLVVMAVSCSALVVVVASPAGAVPPPLPTHVDAWPIATTGDAPDPEPTGVAVGSDGHVYVTDATNGTVKEFTPGGALIDVFGDGELSMPYDVDVGNGFVYVADIGDHKVHRFEEDDHDAEPIEWGGLGTGNGQFDSPEALTVGPDGRVFVVDVGNDRVQVFDEDGDVAQPSIGDTGTGHEALELAAGVSVDQGKVWVLDAGVGEIKVYDATTGQLSVWHPMSGSSNVTLAQGLDVAPGGPMYVTYSDGHVDRLDRTNGAFIDQLGAPGFANPQDVEVTKAGVIYVADTGNHRVQRWAHPRPDARARIGSGAVVGNDVYNANGGVAQTRTGSATPGHQVTFTVSLQNDAPLAGQLRVEGLGSTNTFTVKYLGPTGATITNRVVAGTYTRTLAPGAVHTIKVVVTVRNNAPRGASLTRQVTVRSTADAARVDAVKLVTRRS